MARRGNAFNEFLESYEASASAEELELFEAKRAQFGDEYWPDVPPSDEVGQTGTEWLISSLRYFLREWSLDQLRAQTTAAMRQLGLENPMTVTGAKEVLDVVADIYWQEFPNDPGRPFEKTANESGPE